MRYLLFKISLPFKDGIKILRLIRSLFRADKFSLYDVSEYLFKRHTVFLIHSKEKAREHDKYHCKCRNRRTRSSFEQEEKRQADRCRKPEKENLPLREIEREFAFDFG